jgi:hypothetical protein
MGIVEPCEDVRLLSDSAEAVVERVVLMAMDVTAAKVRVTSLTA